MIEKASSDIISMAESLKADLIAGNDDAINRLILSYSKAHSSLKQQFRAITAQIEKGRVEGKEISPSWVFRRDRYAALMQQLEEQINEVAHGAARTTQDEQLQAWMQGQAFTKDLVLAQSAVTWSTLPDDAAKNIIGFLGDGSPLSYKFADMAPKLAAGIKQAITNGVIQGWGASRILRAVEDVHAESLTNAMTVIRTETMRAYREASHQSGLANAEVLRGWYWMASLSARTCSACWGMHGTFHKLDERMGDHPNGRCTQVFAVKGYTLNIANPEERFVKLPEADQKLILGVKKHELWKEGKLSLRDIPEKHRDKVWGVTIRIKPLKDIEVYREIVAKEAQRVTDEIQKKIIENPEEFPLGIKVQPQNKHIFGTTRYYEELEARKNSKQKREPQSYFEGLSVDDLQKLVDKHAGRGIIARYRPGSEYPSEYFVDSSVEGMTWDRKTQQYVPTNRFEIRYAKYGTHIFPVGSRPQSWT